MSDVGAHADVPQLAEFRLEGFVQILWVAGVQSEGLIAVLANGGEDLVVQLFGNNELEKTAAEKCNG